MSKLQEFPPIRWIEFRPLEKPLTIIGKTLVYVAVVGGILMLLDGLQPQGGSFGRARGADAALVNILLVGFIVLYHAALGFICQGIAQGLRELRAIRAGGDPDAAAADPGTNGD